MVKENLAPEASRRPETRPESLLRTSSIRFFSTFPSRVELRSHIQYSCMRARVDGRPQLRLHFVLYESSCERQLVTSTRNKFVQTGGPHSRLGQEVRGAPTPSCAEHSPNFDSEIRTVHNPKSNVLSQSVLWKNNDLFEITSIFVAFTKVTQDTVTMIKT